MNSLISERAAIDSYSSLDSNTYDGNSYRFIQCVEIRLADVFHIRIRRNVHATLQVAGEWLVVLFTEILIH